MPSYAVRCGKKSRGYGGLFEFGRINWLRTPKFGCKPATIDQIVSLALRVWKLRCSSGDEREGRPSAVLSVGFSTVSKEGGEVIGEGKCCHAVEVDQEVSQEGIALTICEVLL